MILEVDNIELSYKNKQILNGIYLRAETGKTTAILGSNGCGKSCLLQIIFGNLKPKYKLIRINKKPLLKPAYKTKVIGFLPQHNFVPKFLTASNVFKLMKVEWKEFTFIFEKFSRYENYTLDRLSGGERRIIEVYLILKGNFKIILLDEPFSHIEPLHIEKIKTLINIEKQNKIIIITDHLYKHIIESADNIYLLKDGHSKLIDDIKELEFYRYISEASLQH